MSAPVISPGYYYPRKARRLAVKTIEQVRMDIRAMQGNAASDDLEESPYPCQHCEASSVILSGICKECLDTYGHEISLDDHWELEYGQPTAFVRRVANGADVGFRWGPVETMIEIRREDLFAFQSSLPAMLGQLFAPGEDQRVDALLGRKPGDDTGNAPDTISLGLGKDLLQLAVLRCHGGEAWAVRFVLGSGRSVVVAELGAYELLGLYDALCVVLNEVERELRKPGSGRPRTEPRGKHSNSRAKSRLR